MRDPYSIYARDILGLWPLDPLEADPAAADRGTIIHEALDRFVRDIPAALPDDAEARLLEIGRDVFARVAAHPVVHAFWWPRFERVARWFIDVELTDGKRRLCNLKATPRGATSPLPMLVK